MSPRQRARPVLLAIDTSVAVPLLVQPHPDHRIVRGWASGRRLALAGHAVAEVYSVLTRLPTALRIPAKDVARTLETNFDDPFAFAPVGAAALPRLLSDLGIAGGAVYDALVALAAQQAGLALATRDARALDTYRRVGVGMEIVS